MKCYSQCRRCFRPIEVRVEDLANRGGARCKPYEDKVVAKTLRCTRAFGRTFLGQKCIALGEASEEYMLCIPCTAMRLCGCSYLKEAPEPPEPEEEEEDEPPTPPPPPPPPKYEAFEEKMKERGMNELFIREWIEGFKSYHHACQSGADMLLHESDISKNVGRLAEVATLPDGEIELLSQTVIVKLNGGLASKLGHLQPASLVEIHANQTVLDLHIKHIAQLQEKFPAMKFMLLNSIHTEAKTKQFVKERHPELYAKWDDVTVMQHMQPLVNPDTMEPMGDEWTSTCHGDLYMALETSGKLDALLNAGYKYMFVSNVENLAATIDTRFLGRMEESDASMLVEVCQRTDHDGPVGHLARRNTRGRRLVVRDRAQCADEEFVHFDNIGKYKYLNTNNLWLNLIDLKAAIVGGYLKMPVVPRTKIIADGRKAICLDTHVAGAMDVLSHVEVIVVPFTRFVSTNSLGHLVGLRSDAFEISTNFTPVLVKGALRPIISLGDGYVTLDDITATFPNGIPSLKECARLRIEGKVQFTAKTTLLGQVSISNHGPGVPLLGGRLTGEIDAQTVRPTEDEPDESLDRLTKGNSQAACCVTDR